MNQRIFSLALLCFSAFSVACIVDVDNSNTVYSCVEEPICPSGYGCELGVCVKQARPGDADAGPTELVRGDLLYYSFDSDQVPGLAHDRSGNRFDGEIRGPIEVDGKFGSSLQYENNDIVVRDSAKLFSRNVITIEAHVLHLVGKELGVIYGDDEVTAEPDSVEYSFAIDTQDRLEFKTNGGCGEGILTYNSDVTVATVGWHHVAVVWDGSTITFYIDGQASGQASNTEVPCESLEPRSYRVGRLRNEAGGFSGLIDELKVSSAAKTVEDIQASMNYDSSTGDRNYCGDNLIEDEACEPANACCSISCAPAEEGSACGVGGSCNAAAACLRAGGRVRAGLQALYEFNENAGILVADTSGVAPALDLTIGDEAAVTWRTGKLTINTGTTITSAENATKIETAVEDSDAVTVEAWIETTEGLDTTARIVSLSANTNSRNVNIAQSGSSYLSNVRTSLNGAGNPLIDSPAGDVVAGQLTHLVISRAVDGTRRFYVNGVLRSRNVLGGDLNNWSAYPLTLANVTGGGRAWLGTFHLVAIYSRSLTSDEVALNFAAGAN